MEWKNVLKMHVGRKCNKEICPDLHVNGWRLKTVTEVETGFGKQLEEESGLHEMKGVENEKYLGDIVTSDGKNH